jgi:nicotinate-nucleotide--dimethylbenzimidazole phosphoribosyltransferase
MSSTQVDEAVEKGREIGAAIEADVACFGEMGIGNTSSASLVCAKTLGKSVVELVGRGTGLDDAGLHHKRSLLTQASERMPDTLDARSALREYGGFEIAMMTGAMIGAAKAGTVVVIDGFIASAAALCASRISPRVEDNFVYAHRSAEAGHELVLKALNATPLLDLGLRLGEGTGSLLAYPLIRAAADMMRNMASFETAGVSGPA